MNNFHVMIEVDKEFLMNQHNTEHLVVYSVLPYILKLIKNIYDLSLFIKFETEQVL